jgi:hypothetical protein
MRWPRAAPRRAAPRRPAPGSHLRNDRNHRPSPATGGSRCRRTVSILHAEELTPPHTSGRSTALASRRAIARTRRGFGIREWHAVPIALRDPTHGCDRRFSPAAAGSLHRRAASFPWPRELVSRSAARPAGRAHGVGASSRDRSLRVGLWGTLLRASRDLAASAADRPRGDLRTSPGSALDTDGPPAIQVLSTV